MVWWKWHWYVWPSLDPCIIIESSVLYRDIAVTCQAPDMAKKIVCKQCSLQNLSFGQLYLVCSRGIRYRRCSGSSRLCDIDDMLCHVSMSALQHNYVARPVDTKFILAFRYNWGCTLWWYSIGHVNEYPTMYYFGIPRGTQSMIMYKILTEYFWKFEWKIALWEFW